MYLIALHYAGQRVLWVDSGRSKSSEVGDYASLYIYIIFTLNHSYTFVPRALHSTVCAYINDMIMNYIINPVDAI